MNGQLVPREVAELMADVATIKTEQHIMKGQAADSAKRMESIDSKVDSVEAKLDKLIEDRNNEKARIGGIVWTVSALFAALTTVGFRLWEFFHKG